MTSWETWVVGVLAGTRAPLTSENVDTLWAWSGAESLPRDRMSWRNPLCTTQPWPGAVDMNAAGVKRYLSVADGIAATVATLENGFYPVILSNLHKSVPRAKWANACPNLGTWGTGCGWLHTDFGPAPGNLTGGLHMDADVHAAFVALQDQHTKIRDNQVTDRDAIIAADKANTDAIVTAIKAQPAVDLAPLQGAIENLTAIVQRIENALKSP